jgi:predicted transposase/invertase (TIGR01784 family)
MFELLDPKNDFVFKKLFVKRPELLADLINAVRGAETPVEIVDILNPRIEPEDLAGKFIVLDVLVQDTQGRRFNVEMQVRNLAEWLERSLYYLARAYAGQLKRGDDYATLRQAVGINLLDFDLFESERAHWWFRLRDEERPAVTLDLLQLHVLELRKLDRQRARLTSALAGWITYFKHWREDKVMSEIRHPPVQNALEELKQLSRDEETWWRAVARERALHDEVSFVNSARREGRKDGLLEGRVLLLTRQLTLKFGALPEPLQQRLRSASEEELDTWAERVLSADKLDDLFR